MSGFVFRCDGSPSIGMGHVIRCLALASILRECGRAVRFVMRALPGNAVKRVRMAGFEVEVIDIQNKEDTDLDVRDLETTIGVARRFRADCVVVDHYRATPGYFDAFKREMLRVAVIDDLADRDLTAADWILNPSLEATAKYVHIRPDCIKLFGPSFALLRSQFAKERENLHRKFTTNDRRVLVTFGGGESAHLCIEILSELQRLTSPLQVQCVVGGGIIPPKLHKAAIRSRHEVHIHHNVRDMAVLMAWADVSINAAGSTCWELCCMGVPMILLVLSENQEMIAARLERDGCAVNLGQWHPGVSGSQLASTVEELLEDPARRATMSSKGQSMVDGFGAQQAAKSLLTLV